MKTIWKFAKPVRDDIELTGPGPLNIVHIAPNGPTDLLIWAEVDTDRLHMTRRVCVVGTGHPMPTGATWHIASVVAPPFVWHIYEETD